MSIPLAAGSLLADDPPAGKSLSFQRLEGRDLSGADLRNAQLTMTRLHGANLRGADFTAAGLDRVELIDADLSQARGLGTAYFGLGIDARRAIFQRADLRQARIPGMYFEDADFRGADLRGAFLAGRFHGAKFDGADVHDAVLLGALGTEPLRADLRRRGALVDADDFARAVRGGRVFTGCNLANFPLANADLDGLVCQGANLHSARLQGATIRQARMSSARFYWASLAGATLTRADLTTAHFNSADLSNADLSGADCRDATFCGTRLGGAKLIGANLTNADFRGADLTGADLTGATLDGTQWDAAIIADLRGLSSAEQTELRTKAARWKHDLAEDFERFVRTCSMPVWLLTWVAGAGCLGSGWQRTSGHRSFKLLAGLHLLATLPALGYLFLSVSGASPTAQLSGNLEAWSMWVRLWPLAFGLTWLALLGFIPLTIAAWVMGLRRGDRGSIKHLAGATLFTGLSLLASLGTLTRLAPTA